jgi:hypothetical protein
MTSIARLKRSPRPAGVREWVNHQHFQAAAGQQQIQAARTLL